MTVHKDAIATGTLWASVGLNVLALLLSLVLREYTRAGLQSIVIAGITAWLVIGPKVTAYVDAKVAAAIAENETAQLILADVKKRLTSGLRLDLRVEPTSARMH